MAMNLNLTQNCTALKRRFHAVKMNQSRYTLTQAKCYKIEINKLTHASIWACNN